jgi:hypothetical protein
MQNEVILWNEDISSGPNFKEYFVFIPCKKDTFKIGTLLTSPKGVPFSQVLLYIMFSALFGVHIVCVWFVLQTYWILEIYVTHTMQIR